MELIYVTVALNPENGASESSRISADNEDHQKLGEQLVDRLLKLEVNDEG